MIWYDVVNRRGVTCWSRDFCWISRCLQGLPQIAPVEAKWCLFWQVQMRVGITPLRNIVIDAALNIANQKYWHEWMGSQQTPKNLNASQVAWCYTTLTPHSLPVAPGFLNIYQLRPTARHAFAYTVNYFLRELPRQPCKESSPSQNLLQCSPIQNRTLVGTACTQVRRL